MDNLQVLNPFQFDVEVLKVVGELANLSLTTTCVTRDVVYKLADKNLVESKVCPERFEKTSDSLLRLKERGFIKSSYSYLSPESTFTLTGLGYEELERLLAGKNLLKGQDAMAVEEHHTHNNNFSGANFQAQVQVGSNNIQNFSSLICDSGIEDTVVEIQALISKLDKQINQSGIDSGVKVSIQPSIGFMNGLLSLTFFNADISKSKLVEGFNELAKRFFRQHQ